MSLVEGPYHVETLQPPTVYGEHQLLLACAICRALARGKFVLVEEPRK